jgi:VanZ family protein
MPSASEATLQRIHGAIRKTGHVFEYAVLAALAWRARRKPAAAPALGWRWPDAAFAWGWAVVFAATDEFHQSFVSTRTGSPIDVLWDSLGATLALGLLWLLHCRLSAR